MPEIFLESDRNMSENLFGLKLLMQNFIGPQSFEHKYIDATKSNDNIFFQIFSGPTNI